MAIRLNKQTQEKDSIKLLIKQSILNPQYELECILGGKYDSSHTSGVSIQQFNKIISRINGKKEYVTKRPEDKLTINFPQDSRYKNVRVSINGYTAINYYCLNDKLDGIMTNVTMETKERVKDTQSHVAVPAYNMRFNQKVEIPLDKDTSLVKDMLRDWKDLLKVFRYKTTYHFVSSDNMFSIDCSIVRSSNVETRELTVEEVLSRNLFSSVIKPTDEKGSFGEWWKRISANPKSLVKVRQVAVFYKGVKESRVFDNPLVYEVEVEFIGNKIKAPGTDSKSYLMRQDYLNDKDKDGIVDRVFAGIFRHIGILLQSIQDSFYIMSNDDIMSVISNYTNLTKKRDTGELFFGPLPVDLDKNKCIQLPDNVYDDMNRVYEVGNILIDYCVTDKSDGVRNLMFIDKAGDCYLISRDGISTIKSVGVRIPEWANSLFDGEYLEYDTSGSYLNKYMIFDCYYAKGENMMNAEFGDGRTNLEKSRYGAILALTQKTLAGTGVQMISDKLPFRIDKKTFLFGELSTTPANRRNYNLIFQQSARLLGKMNKDYGGLLNEGNLYSYKTDGLIFTPIRLAVRQARPDVKVEQYKQIYSGKWEQCYKWKPAQFLTIDFQIAFLKDIKTNERRYIYYGNQKYLHAELRCMNYQSRLNTNVELAGRAGGSENKYDTSLNALLLNDGISLEQMPLEMPFMSTHPYMGVRDVDGNIIMTTSQCLLPVNESGDVVCEEGEQFYDGDTVEFRYISADPNIRAELNEQDRALVIENDTQRWRAMRVRRGKKPNALNVCLDIWSLIHAPVTIKNITEGLTMTDIEGGGDLNYYISTGTNFVTDVLGLNKFNNFCKGYVFQKYLGTQTNPKLLDLGCGKAGDYFKYIINGVKTFVGIDLSHDNLNNKRDGGATRILKSIADSPKSKALAERTLLINGSMTKSLANGDAGLDMLAKYYLDILYGRFKPNPTTNPRHARFYNLAVDGFNTVTSMYVIHYAFNNDTDLDTYLENVSSSLKDQGYFIGTCLDGNSILDNLNGSATPGMLEGIVDGQTIWMVENKTLDGPDTGANMYDSGMGQVTGQALSTYSTSSPHILGTGNKINVYYETINTLSQENLVDIKFLEYKAKEYGMKLVETRLFSEEPGSLLVEFASSTITNAVEYVENIKKTPALAKWASWQRYFVFQKAGEA